MAWEAPLPTQLLVTSRRVAAELDIPAWKAAEVCGCLERVWFGSTYRVTRTSLDALKDLLDQGHDLAAARTIMYWHTSRGDIPSADFGFEAGRRLAWSVNRRRRRREF